MQLDAFFSICHAPVRGSLPSEAEMFGNFFRQVEAADALGYGCAWVACSHLSTEVQKRNRRPVVPHWQGEIGLNSDIFQLAHRVFARTRRIEVGSAVMNLLCNGGPVARAEQCAAFYALHGLDRHEKRRLRVGFSAGRFDFMNRAYGIGPRDELEEAAWPVLKGLVFAEGCEVFLRLLNGEALASEQVRATVLRREQFRSEDEWAKVAALAGPSLRDDAIAIPRRFEFEELKIVPMDWRRDLLDLVIGSHDPALQADVNRYRAVKVFNLSITRPDVIEDTHRRMAAAYHPDGGPWKREYMPRTVLVFLDEDGSVARERAREALSAYWTALEGTLDPKKVAEATDNAVVGGPEEVAEQVRSRFHPDDRLMLWFDFFDHDCARVIAGMESFMNRVAPRI